MLLESGLTSSILLPAGTVLLGLSLGACVSADENHAESGARAASAEHATAHEAAEHAAAGAHGEKRAQDHEHAGPVGGHGSAPPKALEEPRLGGLVEDFALTDSTGTAFRLTQLRHTGENEGKIAVLTFWCTTCSSCRRIEHDFDAQAREYAERGVRFLMVDSNTTDDAQRVNRFLEEKGLGFRVLMDRESEIARAFGATLTTTTAVIDADGRLRYYGGFGGAEAAVQNLLAGEDVDVPLAPGGG